MQREKQTTVERQNVDVDERADYVSSTRSRRYQAVHVSASPRVMQIYPFPLSRFSTLWRVARYRPSLSPSVHFVVSPVFSSRFITEYPLQWRKQHFHVSAANVRYRFVIITNCTVSKKDKKKEREKERRARIA